MDFSLLHSSPFYELTVLLLMGMVMGFISLFLRQPTIVSFIIVGILVGPNFLGIVKSHEHIEVLAQLGVTLLLFLVGLKLDIQLIKTLGAVSLATGIGQVIFTAIIGFFITLALGMDVINSFYISMALTFSSTIIIVKLLSDKREVDSLYGRIAIGLLIVQDLIVVLTLVVLSSSELSIENVPTAIILRNIILMVIYGIIILIVLWFFIHYVANYFVGKIAHSNELLMIFAIGWTALLATSCDLLGLSKELGGLLAGVSLASTSYREAIASRLSSVRDFLLLFFFVSLGSQLHFSQLTDQIIPAIVLSIFVLIGNPLIMLIIMGYMGYRKRTSFLAGLTVAQISEFSLILMAMGFKLGHVTPDSVGLVTLVGLITITVSVYMIIYSHTLYRWFEPILGLFERKFPYREETNIGKKYIHETYDVILFGLGRYGGAIADHLKENNYKLLAVDFNPSEVNTWRKKGYHVVYGDACDMEFISALPIKNAKWIVCAIPQHMPTLTHDDPRMILIKSLKQHEYRGKIAVSTQHLYQEELFKNQGVDVVFLPFIDAASRAVEKIIQYTKT